MDGTVSFQEPDSFQDLADATPQATLIGKCHELTGPWQEPTNRRVAVAFDELVLAI